VPGGLTAAEGGTYRGDVRGRLELFLEFALCWNSLALNIARHRCTSAARSGIAARSTCEQAHVPAQQPPSGEDARLPPAHAHACWAVDPVGASPQGSHRALGLIASCGRRLDRHPRPVRAAPTCGLPSGSRSEPTVLSPAHRLRTREDFARALRSGRRVPGRLLILHVAAAGSQDPPRAGLAVSKAVGNSVLRHRVARRLRHLLRERITDLPDGTLLVVRAMPAAATASFADLAGALDAGLARCPDAVSVEQSISVEHSVSVDRSVSMGQR
jgi:ribonuclease P protein component